MSARTSRLHGGALGFLVLGVTLFLNLTEAHGFVCLSANGRCVKWQSNTAHMSFFLGTSSGPLGNGTFSWDQNAIFAVGDWNGIGSPFQFTYQVGGAFNDPCGGSGLPRHACDDTGPIDDNPVFFTPTVCGRGFGDILAQTTNCYDPAAADMVNAPVFVNANENWDAYDGPLNSSRTDIRRVLAHEFGHVLGLIHPDDGGQSVRALMNRYVSNVDRPQADDINGLVTVYGGSGPGPVTDDGEGCALAPTAGGNAWWPLAFAAVALARSQFARRGRQAKAAKIS